MKIAGADAECWYRVEDFRYAGGWDADYDCAVGEGRPGYNFLELRVLRHTPKGVWVEGRGNRPRFVLRDAHKRYACPTREDALESFRARKRRQAGILRAQAKNAEQALGCCPTEWRGGGLPLHEYRMKCLEESK